MFRPETKRERAEREEMFRDRIHYSLPCRMGNWNEDLFLKAEQTALFKHKRDQCQLLMQKRSRIKENLTEPVELSDCPGKLRYGENYQIIAPDIQHGVSCPAERSVYLAGLVHAEINSVEKLHHGSPIVGCLDGTPYNRNTFRILGCDRIRHRKGEAINYGDEIYFEIVAGTEHPLYLRCENNLLQIGFHLNPTLSLFIDAYCRFKILHFIPNMRYETEGTSVRLGNRVIIEHVSTGKNLAVEDSMLRTFFGNEHEISCHSFRDSHKMDTWRNMWMIMGQRKQRIDAVNAAAKGEESDVFLE